MSLKSLGLALLLLTMAWISLPQAAQADPTIKISCVGDSITYGYLLPNQPVQNYPAALGRMLGKGYQVGNFGVSGRCMNKQGLYPYWKEAAFQQSMDFQPNIVVIQLGTNDLADATWPYFSTFTADYEDMVSRYQALPTHPLIYVCLPPPIFGDYGYGYSNVREQQILKQIQQVAADTGATIIDNYTGLSDVPQDFDHDTIHPNADGALRLAGNVFLSVAPPGSAPPNIIDDSDPSISYSQPITNGVGISGYLPDGPASGLLGGFTSLNSGETGNIHDNLHVSRTYGDSVSLSFSGIGIDFIAPLGPNIGSADYYIDGQLQQTVDSYNPDSQLQQAVFSRIGLSPGTHVFHAVFKGSADPAQQATSAVSGIQFAVDAFRFYHPIADYQLAGPPAGASLRLTPGRLLRTTIVVNGSNGYRGATTFQVSGLPAGVTASFSPVSVTGTGTTLLQLAASATAAAGSATLTIEGDCGAIRRTIKAALSVTTAQNSFASPSSSQGHTHLLWNHASDGQASVWTMSGSKLASYHLYGPFSGWAAKAIADGPDGITHLLWTKTDGTAAVWDVAAGGSVTPAFYGPYSGWAATAISTGLDGHCHLLWSHTDGQICLWNLNNASGSYTSLLAGPFSGWTAKAVATGAANDTDLLWTHTSGAASSWRIDPKDGSCTVNYYGAFPGWTAGALSSGTDAVAHPLWTSSDGIAGAWYADLRTGAYGLLSYDGLPSFTPIADATGPDNLTHLLWSGPAGISLRDIAPDGTFSHAEYGPFCGWNAVAISADP